MRGPPGVPVGRRASAAPLLAAALVVVVLGGCKLQDVTLAAPEDLVVAEVLLQAGGTQQLAWLHRALGNGSLTVPGATVEVTAQGGAKMTLAGVSGRICVDSSSTFMPDTSGSCYAAATPASAIVPGGSYSLRVTLADGRVLTGTTTVPGAFHLTRPAGMAHCALRSWTLLPITWTRSSGAWIYVSETRLTHVRKALDPSAPNDATLDVTGLSISAQDTTIVFPSEFGLFNRADSADAPVLVALQKGLPDGVTATVTVAAADRNYVQWVRRGSFNPSGTVQIPSVLGGGTGMFASVVSARFDLTSYSTSSWPACGG